MESVILAPESGSLMFRKKHYTLQPSQCSNSVGSYPEIKYIHNIFNVKPVLDFSDMNDFILVNNKYTEDPDTTDDMEDTTIIDDTDDTDDIEDTTIIDDTDDIYEHEYIYFNESAYAKIIQFETEIDNFHKHSFYIN
jgi:hypothetical protein